MAGALIASPYERIATIDPNKIPVCVRRDFIVRIEWAHDVDLGFGRGAVFIHLDLRRWSPRICRQLQDVMRRVSALLGMPIFAVRTPTDPKHRKFLTLMGFRYFGHFKTDRIQEVWIYNNG